MHRAGSLRSALADIPTSGSRPPSCAQLRPADTATETDSTSTSRRREPGAGFSASSSEAASGSSGSGASPSSRWPRPASRRSPTENSPARAAIHSPRSAGPSAYPPSPRPPSAWSSRSGPDGAARPTRGTGFALWNFTPSRVSEQCRSRRSRAPTCWRSSAPSGIQRGRRRASSTWASARFWSGPSLWIGGRTTLRPAPAPARSPARCRRAPEGLASPGGGGGHSAGAGGGTGEGGHASVRVPGVDGGAGAARSVGRCGARWIKVRACGRFQQAG